MTVRYLIGDVFDRLRELPDQSVDLLCTSPPFLALRSYLPADHPDKGKEIGSEATPADFIDTLLALSAEWGRVLAPHGSICVELGDTYSGSGGAGGDYGSGGLREGQGKFDGSGRRNRPADVAAGILAPTKRPGPEGRDKIAGWPLAKSLTGIPTLYPWSLAYGRNLLTGEPSPAGQWRIRNVIVWARPNPPVGALGDKFRPATSYITIACKGPRRYFDLDAVRTERPDLAVTNGGNMDARNERDDDWRRGRKPESGGVVNPAGAPPLDWHADDHPEDGDWLWKLSTQPYKGSHYATFPLELPRRLILAMCPQRVCTVCGKPSERITGDVEYVRTDTDRVPARLAQTNGSRVAEGVNQHTMTNGANTSVTRTTTTVGWSDCGHDTWRPGVVLDPFAGSGTTLEAAQAVGRHAVGIDLDVRNAELAVERVGMFMETTDVGTVFEQPSTLF
jgi:DNA modification methylase